MFAYYMFMVSMVILVGGEYKMDDGFEILMGFLLLGFIILLGLAIILPIRITTGTGEHTGYITAVDQKGILWKNYHIYFKTETESSQEDEYCIIRFDKELAEEVKQISKEKQLVSLKYETFLTLHPSFCHASQITGFEVIK